MEITRELLGERLQALTERRAQALAHAEQCSGAIAMCKALLNTLEENPANGDPPARAGL